jgi:hypothetical protein
MALAHSPRIVTDGLVLCLDAANPKSYPGTGTAWTDLSGLGNNVTAVNNAVYTSTNGGGFEFNNTNYFNLSSPTSLPLGNSDRTIIAFCRTPSSFPASYSHIIHYGQPATNQAFGIAVFSNRSVATHPWQGSPLGGTVAPSTNYCLAVTYTGASTLHNFWINAISQGAGQARAINTVAGELRIGTRISAPIEGFGPDGRIYNVLIYNRALSPEEIQQNFNALRGRYSI